MSYYILIKRKCDLPASEAPRHHCDFCIYGIRETGWRPYNNRSYEIKKMSPVRSETLCTWFISVFLMSISHNRFKAFPPLTAILPPPST